MEVSSSISLNQIKCKRKIATYNHIYIYLQIHIVETYYSQDPHLFPGVDHGGSTLPPLF